MQGGKLKKCKAAISKVPENSKKLGQKHSNLYNLHHGLPIKK